MKHGSTGIAHKLTSISFTDSLCIKLFLIIIPSMFNRSHSESFYFNCVKELAA